MFFCFYHSAVGFNVIGMCKTVSVTNMFQKAKNITPIFQELITQVLFDIGIRSQVFCIALHPVTICIPIGTIELLYLFYNKGWHFECLKLCRS